MIFQKSLLSTFFFIFCGFSGYGQALEKQTTTETLDFDCLGIKVKFLDNNFDEPDYLITANWENFFTDGSSFLEENFAQYLPQHFRVEVKSTGEETNEIMGTLESLDAENNVIDQITNFSLSKPVGDPTSDFFGSKGIILVSDIDEIDDDFDMEACIDPEGIPGNFDYEDDVGNDITIGCEVGGKLRATYQNKVKEINICGGVFDVKNVHLNIFIAKLSDSDPTSIVITTEEVVSEVEFAIQKYNQCCINLTHSIQIIEQTPIGVDLSNGLDMTDNPSETNEMKALIEYVKTDGVDIDIDIIFVNRFEGTTGVSGTDNAVRGRAIADYEITAYPGQFTAGHERTCLIAADDRQVHTFSHEIGHVLSNHGHFGINYSTEISEVYHGFNLMAAGTDVCNGVLKTRRLTSQQIQWMRTATSIPQ